MAHGTPYSFHVSTGTPDSRPRITVTGTINVQRTDLIDVIPYFPPTTNHLVEKAWNPRSAARPNISIVMRNAGETEISNMVLRMCNPEMGPALYAQMV